MYLDAIICVNHGVSFVFWVVCSLQNDQICIGPSTCSRTSGKAHWKLNWLRALELPWHLHMTPLGRQRCIWSMINPKIFNGPSICSMDPGTGGNAHWQLNWLFHSFNQKFWMVQIGKISLRVQFLDDTGAFNQWLTLMEFLRLWTPLKGNYLFVLSFSVYF